MKTKIVTFCNREVEVLRDTDLFMFGHTITDEEAKEFIDWGTQNPETIKAIWHPLTQDAIIKENRRRAKDGGEYYLAFERLDSVYVQWQQGNRPNEGSFLVSLFRTYQLADSTNQSLLKDTYPEYFV